MGRYYEDYHPGRFPNQQLLCETIDRANNTRCKLQTDEANPLTIRLLVSEDAVNQLMNLINYESDKITHLLNVLTLELGTAPISVGLNWTTDLVYYTTASGIANPTPSLIDQRDYLQTRQLPSMLRRDSSKLRFVNEEEYSFPLATAHIAVYNFFSNYGSALDRFANEINRLYSLGIDAMQIDWRRIIQGINAIRGKDPQLANAIMAYHTSDSDILLKYRNRLIHDGLIPLHADMTVLNRWVVYAPDIPNNPLNMTKDALILCRNAQNVLVRFLNNCYGLILAQLANNGQPPW